MSTTTSFSQSESSTSVHGNQNIIGDYNTLNVFEYQEREKTDFFEPNLAQFSPPAFLSPPFAKEITSKLLKHRLIIIGGKPSIDKAEIARHIGWCLHHEQFDSTNDENQVAVLEWAKQSNSQSLDISLRETENPTIFILPKLSPEHLNYDPSRYRNIIQKENHYVIASSDVPTDVWKMSSQQESIFWFEVTPELYSVDYLASVLRQKLHESSKRLPKNLANLDWQKRQDLVDNVLVDNVAAKLKIPSNIDVFVDFICDEDNPDEEKIGQILSRTVDHGAGLTQWYYQLEPRQQLLTVALNFFDGLFDDQLFASLDLIVERVWRQRNPLLVSFDYHDLEDVKSIYNFVAAENGSVKIENRSPERRQALLKMAWQSHRRYILATLNQLAQIVIDSSPSRSTNIELYGSETKQEHIRTVIGTTLSDLGLISIDSIEQTLLQLAASDHPYTQIVAAEAMARWRIFNRDKDLFDTLGRWRTVTQLREIVDVILKKKEENRYDAYAYIRSTIALTVGFAAAYDPPNQLSEELHDLIRKLAFDDNKLVRQRFLTYTLPFIVGQHWKQLENTLWDFAVRVDLLPSIGVSLARAYRSDPDGITGLLDSWQKRAGKLKVQQKDKHPRHREGVLATVALTYGYLPYYAKIGSLTAEQAFKKLHTFLANENEHPFVRIAVIRAISLMAQKRFADIEPYLRNIVADIQPEEEEQVVDIIKDLFLKQRANLEGGERTISINGKYYPIWIKGKTPLTEVESAMFKWINQSKNQNAQEIGLQANIAFATSLNQQIAAEVQKIRISEATRAREVEIEPVAQSVTDQIQTNVKQTVENSSWFINLVAWIVSIGKEGSFRDIIKGLLPEAIFIYREEREPMEFVMSSWQKIEGHEDVNTISILLKRALTLINNRAVWVVVAIIVLMFLCTICNILLSF